MPAYDHLCENCNEEFESFYSVKDDPPTKCELCGFEGKVKRLISFAAPGKVELTGRELKAHLKEEGRKLAKESLTNEKVRANLVGEVKFESQTRQYEKLMSDIGRPKIRSKKS